MLAQALPLFSVLSALLCIVAASNSTCLDYALISIRGTYEIQGPSIAFPGMINQTLGNLTGGVAYNTIYPANTSFQINIASDDITRYINSGLANCPKQVFAILGYSQGASASAFLGKSLIQNNQTAIIDAIKAILVVGNPGHVPGYVASTYAAAEFDEFGGDLTRNYNGSNYLDGAGQIPELFYTQNKVLDICHTQDPVCAPAYKNSSFIPYHLQYGGTPEIQNMGGEFLINKLRAAIDNTTAPNSSSNSSGLASATPTGIGHSITPSSMDILGALFGLFILFLT